MKYTTYVSEAEVIHEFVVTEHDVTRVRLYPTDRLLLTECAKDNSTIADKLLALELLARRLEEQDSA